MSLLPGFGIRRLRPLEEGDRTELVQLQRPLRRVLAFTRRSIHDVINDPIARNEVRMYYKFYRDVERGCEIVDLERWWNGETTL
jgi:hypothetical protein